MNFEIEEVIDSYSAIYALTNYVKARSFHYRTLNNAIILNDKLFRWKIKSTNKCTNCNQYKETLLHF